MSAHHAEGGRRPRSSINAVSALASQQSRLEVPDTGSLRGDLLAAPQVLRETFLGPLGLVCLRTAVEAKIYPELFGQAIADLRRMESLGDTEIQRRAVQRGELAEEATSPLMLKTVIGPLILRYLSTQVDELPDFEAAFDHDAAPLVDFVWTVLHMRSPLPPIARKAGATTVPEPPHNQGRGVQYFRLHPGIGSTNR